MPDFCAAYGCTNARSLQTRTRGITFHKFPKCSERRRQWERALRREGFVANDRTVLCSEHFRNEDFDRTGQTIRIKAGAVPTVFNFPAHLQRPVAPRSTNASRKAGENQPMYPEQDQPPPDVPQPSTRERQRSRKRKAPDHRYVYAPDHQYAMPSSPKALKAKLDAAMATVRKMWREKSNALARVKRAKKNMKALLEELKAKNLINEELNDKLECYSGRFSLDQNHPDFVPSLFSFTKPGDYAKATTKMDRFIRRGKRAIAKDLPYVAQSHRSPRQGFQSVQNRIESWGSLLRPGRSQEVRLPKSVGKDVAYITKLVEEIHGLQEGEIIPFIYDPPEQSRGDQAVQMDYEIPAEEQWRHKDHTYSLPPDELPSDELLPQEQDDNDNNDVNATQTEPENQSNPDSEPPRTLFTDGSQRNIKITILTAKDFEENKPKFTCSVCGKLYKCQKPFEAHVSKHTDDQNKCSVCGKKFSTKSHLNTHMRIHTGEKPYGCSFCERRFRQKNALDGHLMIHTGKPFECGECEKKFRTKSALELHLKKHEEEREVEKGKRKGNTEETERGKECSDGDAKETQSLNVTEDQPVSEPSLQTDASSTKSPENEQTEKRETNPERDKPAPASSSDSDKPKEDLFFTGMWLVPVKMSDIEDKPKKNKFECTVCEKSFKARSKLSDHMTKHTGERPYQCTICHKRFSTRNSFGNHTRIHTGEKPFSCSFCDKTFREKNTMEAHLAVHTGKPFNCNECGKKFASRGKLSFHTKKHLQDKPYSCSVCQKTFESMEIAEEHLQIHKKEEETTEMCNFSVKYMGGKYLCSECGKIFYQKVNFEAHMRVHTGEKPFSCSVCGLKYSSKMALTFHMMLHTGEKPFSCSVCQKGFRQKLTLEMHMLTHTGEKPFSCDICGGRFRQKSALRSHELIHTGERPFPCSLCPKRFKSSQSLNHHMGTHAGGHLRCSICGKTFMNPSSLQRHAVKTHIVPQSHRNTGLDSEKQTQTEENINTVLNEDNALS